MLPAEREALVAQAAEAILGPAVYTREQAAAVAGVSHERATTLWRAMGFPEPGYDEALFTERDVAALRTADALVAGGVVDEPGLVALARAMAQALSRLAVSHTGIAGRYVEGGRIDAGLDLVPMVGELVEFVWRRHLAGAAENAVAALLGEDTETAPTLVAFADLVGFTERTRESTEEELAALVESFEAVATEIVGARGGRIVKTLGDEVLFTNADLRAGVDTALALADALEVRVGAAYGPVLARLGDVFGTTVNVASRLTGIAYPRSVLVDREAAQALRGDERYDVTPTKRRSVRGYAHLAPFRVRSVSRA